MALKALTRLVGYRMCRKQQPKAYTDCSRHQSHLRCAPPIAIEASAVRKYSKTSNSDVECAQSGSSQRDAPSSTTLQQDGTTIKAPSFAATRNSQATGAIEVLSGSAMRAQVAPCGKWQAATFCSSSPASTRGGSRLASRAPFVAAPARGRRLPAAAADPQVGRPEAGPWYFTETGQKTW